MISRWKKIFWKRRSGQGIKKLESYWTFDSMPVTVQRLVFQKLNDYKLNSTRDMNQREALRLQSMVELGLSLNVLSFKLA